MEWIDGTVLFRVVFAFDNVDEDWLVGNALEV